MPADRGTPRWLVLGVILLLAPTLLVASTPPAAAAPVGPHALPADGGVAGLVWTTFHGSENRSGASSVDGPTSSLVGWTSCLTSEHLRVGPISDGSRVYVGGDLGSVYAINNTVEGPLLWSRTLPAPPTQMDLAGERLLVATTLGGLYALDALTGAIDWRILLGTDVAQGLAVDGGNVLVPTASGEVQAYDVATGAPVWQVSLGGPAGGAVAVELGNVYAVSVNGSLEALTADGRVLWRASVGATVTTAPAVSAGRVVVGDEAGRVSAYDAASGALLWRWVTPDRLGDAVDATPALGDGAAFVVTDNGEAVAINLTNGSTRWRTGGEYSPYPTTAAPVIAPNGLYAMVNGLYSMVDFSPSNGSILWLSDILGNAFSSPAIVNGQLLLGTDVGCVFDFGPGGPPFPWNVTGTVRDTNGTALAGAFLSFGGGSLTTFTDPNGSFSTQLANGSWSLRVEDPGYLPQNLTVTVSGAPARLAITLTPLVFYSVEGRVVNAYTGAPLANASVQLAGPYGFTETARTSAGGVFFLRAPNGTSEVTAVDAAAATNASSAGGGRFAPLVVSIRVAGSPVGPLLVRLVPLGGSVSDLSPDAAAVWLPLVALGLALAFVAARERSRRRVAVGLSPELLSPFGQYVLQRLLLLPAQVLGLLAILYFVGNALPGTPGCGAGDAACAAVHYVQGFGHFLSLLLTGQWGYVTYGSLRAPTTTILAWWIPNSIELAAITLPLSAAIAYPLGLLSGWRPGSRLDEGSRVVSIVVMMIPTILVALLLFTAIDPAFYRAFGDLPNGLTPSTSWFGSHGGFPSWWVFGGSTRPTGFPLLDGALHGDVPFVELTLAKLLLQAFTVALVYVTVFLRHARNTTAEVVRELHLVAARARGVSERTLLWSHTRRRVLPLYVLIFSLTIPTYLGTQAVVELLFSDTGFGTLLFYEITNIGGDPLGFSGPLSGNFYQVALLLLLLLLLVSILSADIVARYLDPRARGAR